jgi:hypothetical protein
MFSVLFVLNGRSPFSRTQERRSLMFPIMLSGRMENSQNAKTWTERGRVAPMSLVEMRLEKKDLCCPLQPDLEPHKEDSGLGIRIVEQWAGTKEERQDSAVSLSSVWAMLQNA